MNIQIIPFLYRECQIMGKLNMNTFLDIFERDLCFFYTVFFS